MKKQWSVPFETRTTEIWEVTADTKAEATMLGVLARERYKAALAVTDSMIHEHPDKPTHAHSGATKIGSVNPTLPDVLDTES